MGERRQSKTHQDPRKLQILILLSRELETANCSLARQNSDCHIRLVRRDMCLVLEAQHEGDCAEQQSRPSKGLSNAPSNPT